MKDFRTSLACGKRLRGFAAAVAASVALSGCGVVNHMIYKTTGDVMQGFSRNHTVPYLMESEDLAMGCAMSEATAPLLMSFGRVTSEPDQLAVMLYLSSGSCAEEQAMEHELAGLAAMHGMDGTAAEDACLLSGQQALNAQIQATSSIGVPFNIGSVVGRATQCLDNKKWWGAPMGLRATVWAMIPGTRPEGEVPLERLAIASEQGKQAGVRLGHVFQAIAAGNKGDEALVKAVIRDHAESLKNDDANEEWRFVDAMATNMLVAMSDRLWVENTGHRTPMGQFGSFWDDQQAPTETMDLDDLL